MSAAGDGLSPVARWRNAVRDHPTLEPNARLLALVLSTYMDAGGNGAYPSKQTLARGCGLTSERAVYEATRRLELAELLTVRRSKGRTPHTYKAILPPLEPGPRKAVTSDRRDTDAYLD